MNTIEFFLNELKSIPIAAAWNLSRLSEAKGKQELFSRQSPQKLKTLKEHALIQSAVSSNRIEGVEVKKARVGTVIFGNKLLSDRDEEEVRGYRDALNLVHEKGKKLKVSEKTILQMHRFARGKIWDAGKYKEEESDIIEIYEDGRSRVRFKTVAAAKTPMFMEKLIACYLEALKEQTIPPLVLSAAFNLDFLCIHPFRDGNGRVSRLLLLLQCYHHGYEAGRYVSIERLIEQNKERYYETLEESSRGWHEGKHDPWPYINYVLFIIKEAYREFERRLESGAAEKGEKSAMILQAIEKTDGPFKISMIREEVPGASLELIRKVVKNLQAERRIKCIGRGPNAHWQKIKPSK
jgi:Fic family protein